jgi:hypothetical protein
MSVEAALLSRKYPKAKCLSRNNNQKRDYSQSLHAQRAVIYIYVHYIPEKKKKKGSKAATLLAAGLMGSAEYSNNASLTHGA